ncbi:metal-dependent hydrolase family protein [Nesterenkonia haasae]|uniref:metal-dependent hydrolase family protein n=1 Tax=Nesterenkonia haasae TaxID=2587813 RepID=UPI001391534F|nr:amidohydrolase family protein [Nesterenkonia haasae]NDK32702.1 amidohydrolase family protein [Nesterenkonia haasae]
MKLDTTHRAVTDVRILDPETETISDPTTIRVSDDRIVSIGDQVEPGDQPLDAGGSIAIPGLIDCHVHVLANSANLGGLGDQSPSYLAASAINTMQDALRRGFTTLRDAGGADFGLAQAAAEGLFTAPRLFYGGKAISQTGGHADMRAPGTTVMDTHQCCPHMGVVCDGVSEVRRAARHQLRTGADHIKLMLSGGVASPTDRVDSTQFSDEEIRAAVEEAEAANRYALGHAYTARAINRGLRLGVRSIEHGNLLDEESVRLFREHDAFLVPTLVTYQRLRIDGAANGLPRESQDKVENVLYAGIDALRLADQGDVNIAYGSDLLGDMRSWQSHEFMIRSEVQSPGAVLRSATTTAARLLRQEGELGRVTPGARADFLLLKANPLEDIRILAEPESSLTHVFSRGGLVTS